MLRRLLGKLPEIIGELVGMTIFTTITVGAVIIATPWGDRFALFIDHLAGR